jgi:hypothetical protein
MSHLYARPPHSCKNPKFEQILPPRQWHADRGGEGDQPGNLPGRELQLVGAKRRGKSTTIALISGLLLPTTGDAWIGDCSITKQPLQAKHLLGFIPQEIALYPELSAYQILLFLGQRVGL